MTAPPREDRRLGEPCIQVARMNSDRMSAFAGVQSDGFQAPRYEPPGGAARKLDQSAARKVIHLKDVHSTLVALSRLFSIRGRAVGSAVLQAVPTAWLRTRAASLGRDVSASDSSCPWW